MSAEPPHRLYRSLVDAIERECRVAEWRSGDIGLWPLASQDLFLDLFRKAGSETAPPRPTFVRRAASTLATPLANLWKSRRDIAHWVPRPHRADAIFLGDGVSLDCVEGVWRDRFCEPIVSAYEQQDRSCFVMQSGNLTRLPWARPTYAANRIAARASVEAVLVKRPPLELPDRARVLRLLEQAGVHSPSLGIPRLARRARTVAAQAAGFDRLLRHVQPKVAFVVTYYSGLGHAFALACRRRRILCVDLQHCPHDGVHRAYRWSELPASGYSTLPGLFWSWSEADAADIRRWSDGLWHRAIAGGHTQIASLGTCAMGRQWRRTIGYSEKFEREILVALQPIGGKQETWAALSKVIECAPHTWRWWIRRHPSSTSEQDASYARLLSLRFPNLVEGQAAQIPLPALLSHMDALVSLASGAAVEAAMFGVPAFFLDEEALDTFPRLIARGEASLVDVDSLQSAIAALPVSNPALRISAPPLEDTLRDVDRIAAQYSRLCAELAGEELDCGGGIVNQREAPRAA
jgi:hypothetical protein